MFINKNRIKMILQKNVIMAKHYFDNYSNLLYDETTIPYISIYYYNPKPYNDEEIIIPIYITDFYQREYYYNDTSLKFTLRYEIDGVVNYINNIKAGDHNLSFGTLSEGMHYYSIQVIDSQGRESRRIYNDLYVVDRKTYDITDDQTYVMTSEDLTIYNINNENSAVEDDMINNRIGLTNLFSDVKNKGFRKIILLNGTYRVNRAIPAGTIKDKTCPILIPSEFTIDMNNSTIKLHPYDDREYGNRGEVNNVIIKMENCFDSHLINGTIKGDYYERVNELVWEDGSNAYIGSNGEFNFGAVSYGSEFSSFENITFDNIAGYNVGATYGGNRGNGNIGEWQENISVENGVNIDKEGYITSNLGTMDENMINNKYIVASVWLGYGGIRGHYWDMDFHFYDENEKFIETIKVYQYTRCRIPENSKYFRITIKGNITDVERLQAHNIILTRYFTCKNCHWIDNRTCANPAHIQFYAYLNCDFTRSGQNITPCEIDLEDGWENQQDIFIKGCSVLENVGTADVIDSAGLNHVYENNTNMSFTIRHKVNGVVIRNNISPIIDTTIGYMTNNTIRIYDNNITGKISLGQKESNFFGYEKTKVKLKNNIMKLGSVNRANGFYVLDNCDITFTKDHKSVHCINSIIRMEGWAAYENEEIEFENCNFESVDGVSEINLQFNVLDTARKFNNCSFNFGTGLYDHGLFNSGIWNKCIFNDYLIINPKHSNTMGDIQFNNCVFKGIVTIKPQASDCYIQFNNCTFEQTPVFAYFGETNSEFNNCILP